MIALACWLTFAAGFIAAVGPAVRWVDRRAEERAAEERAAAWHDHIADALDLADPDRIHDRSAQ